MPTYSKIALVASRSFGEAEGKPLFLVLERCEEPGKWRANPKVVWALRSRHDVNALGASWDCLTVGSSLGPILRFTLKASALKAFRSFTLQTMRRPDALA
jgi:hypothetical protein